VSQSIHELTDKVWRAVTQDAYDANDIGALISTALDLNERAEAARNEVLTLQQDRARLVKAMEIAGRDNERLRSALDKYEHLTQFAEEVVQ